MISSDKFMSPLSNTPKLYSISLGETNRVKCWYCNGGLQTWASKNEPWREHAKWFPMYV